MSDSRLVINYGYDMPECVSCGSFLDEHEHLYARVDGTTVCLVCLEGTSKADDSFEEGS